VESCSHGLNKGWHPSLQAARARRLGRDWAGSDGDEHPHNNLAPKPPKVS
jgi:hypothetical protein